MNSKNNSFIFLLFLLACAAKSPEGAQDQVKITETYGNPQPAAFGQPAHGDISGSWKGMMEVDKLGMIGKRKLPAGMDSIGIRVDFLKDRTFQVYMEEIILSGKKTDFMQEVRTAMGIRKFGKYQLEPLSAEEYNLKLGVEIANDFLVERLQIVGLYFRDLGLPQNAQILEAKIRFQVDRTERNVDPCVMTISTEQEVSPLDFSKKNLSGRKETGAVIWEIPKETGISKDEEVFTSDLKELIHIHLQNEKWVGSAQSMVFFIKGAGLRSMRSFDKYPDKAPRLVIRFKADGKEQEVIRPLTGRDDDAEERIGRGSMDIHSSDLELGAEERQCRYDFVQHDLHNLRVRFFGDDQMRIIYPYSRNEMVDKGNGGMSEECTTSFGMIMLKRM